MNKSLPERFLFDGLQHSGKKQEKEETNLPLCVMFNYKKLILKTLFYAFFRNKNVS